MISKDVAGCVNVRQEVNSVDNDNRRIYINTKTRRQNPLQDDDQTFKRRPATTYPLLAELDEVQKQIIIYFMYEKFSILFLTDVTSITLPFHYYL